MTGKISPLAPVSYAQMPAIDGVKLASHSAAIKYSGRDDLTCMIFAPGTQVAGVYTTSKCPSAPVDWCKSNLQQGKARALIVNSGNANAFTGQAGQNSVEETAKFAAQLLDCPTHEIFLASTGVIGEPLDPTLITRHLDKLIKNAKTKPWENVAKAIMTTDTYPKYATCGVKIGDINVTINGTAKGSGMIAPDMATMLSFIVTDAALNNDILQSLLNEATQTTFNAITVDSDTSTSDTVLLFATQCAGDKSMAQIQDANDPLLNEFRTALHALMHDLAMQIVRDGEGARKQIAIQVKGAFDNQSAKKIALSIANSPLVKTAIAGEDANWGRIVMAVGKAGEPAQRDKLAIWFGPFQVAKNGQRMPNYSEDDVAQYMRNDEIDVTVDLEMERGHATIWTCDLTKEYVAINGDYRS